MFLRLKSLFFDTIFLKKSQSFCRAETPFSSKNSPSIFHMGEIALKFAFFANFTKNLNCSYLFIKGSKKPFEGMFGLYMFFEFLRLKSLIYDYIFLEKSWSFWGAQKPFSIFIFEHLSAAEIDLIFSIFQFCEHFKLIITLD